MKQSFAELLGMIVSMPGINKNVKRLREKGYPVKNVLDLIGNDENIHTVVYTSPEFQPYSDTFPDKYAFVGPSIRRAASHFEKTRETMVYISMGTVNNDMLPLYKKCVSAFAHTEYQIILSVGDLVSAEDFGVLPENISVFPHVDQIAVLQQADVFVSHCGMNSVNESLYFGVPLVMLPQTAEQRGVAERVWQLGAGIKLDKTDPMAIRKAVVEVLSDMKYRNEAAFIAESFHRCSGAKGAADKIESVSRYL